MGIENEYLKIVKARFRSVKSLGDMTMEQLSEEELHWTLNEESNSVAVIVKHLSGNMVSRWTDIFHTDGEKPNRNRELEFEDDLHSKVEILKVWEKGWTTLFEALDLLTEQDLLRKIMIRGEGHLVLEAIERQMAHYAYHIGQIVYIGKQIKCEQWVSLSIPIGKSEEYLQQMLKKHTE